MVPTGVYTPFNELKGLNINLRSGKPKKPETLNERKRKKTTKTGKKTGLNLKKRKEANT